MRTLAVLREGEEAEIIGFQGGRGLIKRLLEMGFTRNAKIKVLSNSPGPVLVDVRGSKVALGRGMAMKIIVNGEG